MTTLFLVKCAVGVVLLVAVFIVVAFSMRLKVFGCRFLVFDFDLDAERYRTEYPDDKFIGYVKYGR